MSAGRRADLPRRQAVRELVFTRDGHRCMLSNYGVGPCSGRLEMHELRKASQTSDGYTVDNGLTLCTEHNQWVERAGDVAHSLGLVIRRGDPEGLAAARRIARGITAERRR